MSLWDIFYLIRVFNYQYFELTAVGSNFDTKKIRVFVIRRFNGSIVHEPKYETHHAQIFSQNDTRAKQFIVNRLTI